MLSKYEGDPVHFSNWSWLCGYDPKENILKNIKMQNTKNFDEQNWLQKILKANLFVNKIDGRKELIPEIIDIDSTYKNHFDQLINEPVFKEYLVGTQSYKFAFIELKKIKTFQTHINLEYIESLIEKIPSPDDIDSTIRFTCPLFEQNQKQEVFMAKSKNGHSVSLISDNLDFRIIGNADGEDSQTKRRFTGFGYGFGLPVITVVEYKGMFFLKNGYHRAYALLKQGHKYLPCLLIKTDSFEATGANNNGFFSIDLLLSDKCPLLADFDSDGSIVYPRRRTKKVITIQVSEQVIPI